LGLTTCGKNPDMELDDSVHEEVQRPYMGGGQEVFEDADPKYIEFLQSRAKDVRAPKKKWQFWK